MKSIEKILLILLFNVSLIKAQTGSLPLIEDLESDSINYGIRELAIYEVKHNKLLEYIPYLDTSVFKQPHYYLVSLCLETLSKLNSSNIIPISKAFIDSLDSPSFLKDEKDKIDIIESRLFATEILFEHGDYTTAQYIFDYINANRDSLKHYVFFIRRSLKLILMNVPSFAEQAKTELIYMAQNNSWDEMRWLALLDLNNVLGSEMNYLNVDRLINDEESGNRISALVELFENNYPDLDELIKERLYADTSRYVRIVLADTLLKVFGTPANYNLVKNYLQIEQNQIARSNIEVSLELLMPKPPYYLNDVIEYVDYSFSLCDTLLLYSWLGDLDFSNTLKNTLNTAKSNLQNGDSLACRVQIKEFQDLVDNVYKDSLNTDPRFVTIEGWKFLYWNAQYILDRLPEPQTNPNLLVNLKNSLGNQIPASNVMYYEGSWKDAVNNGDGTFTVITTKPTVSIRMFYEYANQTVNNVPAQNNTYTFTTVNTAVELRNSTGNLILTEDQGTVQYYAGAWRSFGTTANGVAHKELLPVNYSFRMTYEGGNQDKQQNLSDNQTVVFQTVNAAVQLKNSSGNLIDEGTVQYYAGAWRSFGTTVNGVAYKELLPVNYSFRMTYEYVSNDKQQNLSENPVVDFNTVLCTIKATNANNQPLEGANTKYYSLAWRDIGLTNSNGEITKELLPKNLSFRATYNNVSQDKQQDISVNNLVEILLNVP